jgi:serine/threonine protein kinase
MSPDTLIGREIGKSVLQRLQGRGTMGAVYLASRAGRQVAVKIFLPASALEPAEHEEFSQRLEKVIAQATSLDHPSILAILDYGRQAGLTYLVMPYIGNENLEALLKQTGALPFARVQRYLVQMAAALDYAHTRGVLHCDLKPANILLTPEGNALLSDFGLAGLTTEKHFARVRQAHPGMLNAIAPEYVLGQPISLRADMYSLGAVLYQMVTGLPPFQGNSLAEVAVQHIKGRPLPPCTLRPDLPRAAGEVILRALAKQPDERYACARDLASAFQLALDAAFPDAPRPTSALDMLADLASGTTAAVGHTTSPRTGSLFDPKWQSSASLPVSGGPLAIDAQTTAAQPPLSGSLTSSDPGSQTMAADTTSTGPFVPPTPSGNSTRRTGLLSYAPRQTLQASPAEQWPTRDQRQANGQPAEQADVFARSANLLDIPAAQPLQPPTGLPASVFGSIDDKQTHASPFMDAMNATWTSTTAQPDPPTATGLPPAQFAGPNKARLAYRNRWLQISALLMLILVTVAAASVFLLTRNQGSAPPRALKQTSQLTIHAQATATASAYIILSDTLSQNTHNWPVGSQGWYTCSFEGGAYHILNSDKNRSAPALLPGETITSPFMYTLTMQQIKGDETVFNNLFGMILDASIQNVQGKQIDRFYAFEILNKTGGQYQFWKYDNSKNGNPWKSLWTKNFGKEFSQGSGPAHSNTVKIIATGSAFTFLVNGTQVGTIKDSSFSSGSLGMLVNLNGAEVAFSSLLVTHV